MCLIVIPFIIAYLIWKGSYNKSVGMPLKKNIIAYLIWKGSYNDRKSLDSCEWIIAYLIWKGSYNMALFMVL